uniref:Odorant binding protein n=1 Tax=Eogystia hippophaecolus TaxID=1206364 RepID=A0A1B3P5L8_EOGHI|nr:odorant binding protein [Eogystia hippophaecolus]
MKFLFLCFIIAAGSLDAHNVHLSQSQKDKVHQYTLQCITESGVKPEVIAEAKKGHFNDDEALKKFILCFFQKSSILNGEGKLDVEAALSKLPSDVDKTAVKKVLEDCKNKTGKSTADTAFEIFKCYYKGTPTHVIFS